MKKSPEQYFQEQNFSVDLPQDTNPGEFSEAEKAFMEKYMGVDTAKTLQSLGIALPSEQPSLAAPPAVVVDAAPEQPVEEDLEQVLRRETDLLLVGFFLGDQEFVVPTLAVQEVIRSSPPSRLPAAPAFVAGVINLRGKVTPLIRLREMLEIGAAQTEDQFIIVCRRKGLQVGLMIERVHTMYRVSQSDIDWAVEARLGASVDLVSGLLKLRENIISIVSVDRIIEKVIRR